ncbi:MAG: NAD(P)H-dependent oxidoreductase [Roseibium sp.]|uniref:NADPH-dependent FMN reductase n=1 Tax=Roseibium sp. TaxID=1936156 RepID=UPI0026304CED|nr:NADPH-dependent FMN reductase [Roseibium sp.]MCV0424769.1 NAD(P)H-dependent oxidoreductase [Roseibium sp.]
MKFLAISGSSRSISTNTAMLRAVSKLSEPDHDIVVFASLASLPVFSPDAEDDPLPKPVKAFVDMIRECDGLIIASPEYVRAIPGGLKNAIDWLVSREEIIGKPIALMHASHRGHDMLDQLRLVLSTVSDKFAPEIFLAFELVKFSPEEISQRLKSPPNRSKITDFLKKFAQHCA